MASSHQNKVKKQLEANGWTVLKVIRLGNNGYPDLLCQKNGLTIWVESKETWDTLKPLQKQRIKELTANGFKCFVEKKGQHSELLTYLESF
jgi:Holliday junction resolvase